MSKIDFNSKINYQRYYGKPYHLQKPYHYNLIKCFESDRGRIVNSAAIRRLQQKTQVFPLERNAVVRTRLTHSLEVQQIGRYIFKEMIYRLQEQPDNNIIGLIENATIFESVIEMACLMHDIGNPPFGHFGEAAINAWFINKMAITDERGQPLTVNEDRCHYSVITLAAHDFALNNLKLKIRQDLCRFDGNAQAIRLIHHLLRLNLTYTQIASILKYTRPAYWQHTIPADYDYLMKKPGFYLSEESFINELQQQLEMGEFSRYPMSYIMEAADDISYCIADLEDAVEKRIFTVEQLYHYLLNAWGPKKDGDLFTKTVEHAYQQMLKLGEKQHKDAFFFMNLRVKTVDKLVPHSAERFIENIHEIFKGTFNQALLAKNSAEVRLLEMFKKVGHRHVFNHESIENLELQGSRIIYGLLDIYGVLLAMPYSAFIELVQKDHHADYLIETRLFHKLPLTYRLVYKEKVESLNQQDQAEFVVYEFYYRCRLIQDYISSITDHFAHDEYRKLMVVA